MNLSSTFIFSDSVFFQEIDNEMVLLDTESENYFGLDEVGCDIWKLLKEGNTLQETYSALLDMYEVEPEVLKNDLLNFVEKLSESGLVKVESRPE